jgi:type II secretory pathway pseudopilin PulG
VRLVFNTMKKNSLSAGQTLVEAVVVVGVVVLLVTGLIAGTTASLRSAQSGRTRTQAVSLAQEGIEIARGLRDENWNAFEAYTGSYCLGDDRVLTISGGTCAPNITTPEGTLSREITFDWQDPKMIITVVVSYLEGESTRDVTLTTYFTQWK